MVEVNFEEVFKVLRDCIEAKNIHDALGIITTRACKLVGGGGGSIWLRSHENPDRIVLRWSYRPDSPNNPNRVGIAFYTNVLNPAGFHDGLTGWVFATGKPLLLKDITDEEEVRSYPRLIWKDKFNGFKFSVNKRSHRPFMAVPVLSTRHRGRVIAVLRVAETSDVDYFTAAHLDLLTFFAGQIAGLLTNYLSRQEEEVLLANLFVTPYACDIEPILDRVVQAIPVVLDGSFCSIFLRAEQELFRLEATNSPALSQHTRRSAGANCTTYKAGEGKTGKVAASGVALNEVGDIKSQVRPPEQCECQEPSAFLAVPIKKQAEVTIGVIRVVRAIGQGEGFSVADRQFVENCADRLFSILSFCGFVARGNCFVIMPFRDPIWKIYNTIIKPTVEKDGFVCKTEADYKAPGALTPSVVSHIASASLLIAEITNQNPNVYYELGIAHALDQAVILLTQKAPPSDIRYWKYIKYEDSIDGARRLEESLTKAIAQGLSEKKFRVRW